jgi:hypothetical protein
VKVFYIVLRGLTKGLEEVIKDIINDEINVLVFLNELVKWVVQDSEDGRRDLQDSLG